MFYKKQEFYLKKEIMLTKNSCIKKIFVVKYICNNMEFERIEERKEWHYDK